MIYSYFKYFLLLVVNLAIVSSSSNIESDNNCPNVKNPLGLLRKRRHLAFPEGSIVSMSTSAVKTFMTHAPSGWYLVLEVDLAYHLPDAKVIAAHHRRKVHHRQKRELWDTLLAAFELRNMNGRACVIRSICEAQHRLASPGRSLIHDLLRIMFTAPLHEREFNEEIGLTYNEIWEPNFCDRANDCPFSLLDFVLDLNKVR